MGEWQRDAQALGNESDIVYLLAMTENCDKQPAKSSELSSWASELNVTGVLMTDPARAVYDAYADANGCKPSGPGGPGCSNAVTVLIDKKMKVRYFGATYECGTGEGSTCGKPVKISADVASCLDSVLKEIKALVAE